MLRSPDAPPTCPAPAGFDPQLPDTRGATGPELAQSHLTLIQGVAGMFGGATGQGRQENATYGDYGPAQNIPIGAPQIDAITTTAAGDDSTLESYPGRIRPHADDGEPGWVAVWGMG